VASNVPGGSGSYLWTVPPIPTSQARLRIRNALDSLPVSTSGVFTIRVALMSISQDSLSLIVSNAPVSDTLRIFNTGNGTLVISDIQNALPNVRVSRRVLSIPPQSSDTITITALPSASGQYLDTLRIVSNAPVSPALVKVSVQSLSSIGREPLAKSPRKFELEQNYPNPFNPSTVIRYRIAEPSMVVLKVYDVLGRELTTLVHERQAAGQYSIVFNAQSLSSGTYFYRLTAGEFTSIKKMLLVK